MGTAKETILIVEDSTDLRECFSECLTDEGYEVTIAAHGQEGLDHQGRHHHRQRRRQEGGNRSPHLADQGAG